MKFIKGYKKLYEIEKEKNSELRKENDALREKEEKEIIPFSLKVYFDVEDVTDNARYIIFENVIEYKTDYAPPFLPIAENWIIKTADGLTSVIDYKKVVCIVACRKQEEKEQEELPIEYFRGNSMSDEDYELFIKKLKEQFKKQNR